MSNFHLNTKNPKTGKMELAEWLDGYFGSHKYGIRFPDGEVYRSEDLDKSGIPTKKYSLDFLGSDRAISLGNDMQDAMALIYIPPPPDDFTWDEMFMLKELLNYVFECGDL